MLDAALKPNKADATVGHRRCEEATFKLEGSNTFLDSCEGAARFLFARMAFLGVENIILLQMLLFTINKNHFYH